MSDVPYVLAYTWQEACDICLDQPVILVWFRGTHNDIYMRYHREFYLIDRGPYCVSGSAWRWCIAGVWFNHNSISWMVDNTITMPFTREDRMLYYMTWGDCCE